MPKIYEYKKINFLFYSNDHPPPHCHIKKGKKEIKAVFDNAGMWKYEKVSKALFSPSEKEDIRDFVKKYNLMIIMKWEVFFSGKKPRCEKINKL